MAICCWLLCFCVQEEKTPIHLAAEDGHMGSLRLFLRDYHADATLSSIVSESFIHCASQLPCTHTPYDLFVEVSTVNVT